MGAVDGVEERGVWEPVDMVGKVTVSRVEERVYDMWMMGFKRGRKRKRKAEKGWFEI